MHNVLYALSAVVVIVAVVTSLVALRRAHEGLDLDLELTAVGRLDDLLRVPADRDRGSSLSQAA